jgi:hypothetical protein
VDTLAALLLPLALLLLRSGNAHTSGPHAVRSAARYIYTVLSLTTLFKAILCKLGELHNAICAFYGMCWELSWDRPKNEIFADNGRKKQGLKACME